MVPIVSQRLILFHALYHTICFMTEYFVLYIGASAKTTYGCLYPYLIRLIFPKVPKEYPLPMKLPFLSCILNIS
jgi:hypothetical protein